MICAVLLCGIGALGIDYYVVKSTEKYILTPENAGEGYDCILVLGCGVHGDTPSHMLEDRLLQGIELYEYGASEKMLMSGDHGKENYDEVNVMKDFAVERGVSAENIFMDHAGFSTYESMYRAKEIFTAEKILIVTQDYHLHRAIYDARAMGMEAYGVASNPRTYAGQLYRDIREILARNKDFLYCIIKPEPTYLGEEIPVQGNGNVTNDK
ncbi:MAG: ElyC/SanA/YdcF family protein [Acutalibacteraceae bacterium]|nr:ElyC/SanA/YdcF family protein [Acutalibacteraceae bacterium]